MKLSVNAAQSEYDIIFEPGAIGKIDEYLNLCRKVMIVTDSGVPAEYAKTVLEKSENGRIFTFPAGEESKTLVTWEKILTAMAEFKMTRADCVVAVGGGVVGDMAGFAAASYMRGVDFYNLPTTLLSQIDSSVGGKVAVDLSGYKNLVGAFYPPKAVVIDPELLATLPERERNAGMAEALKMALTSDKELYSIFKEKRAFSELSTVIERALRVKISVVEEDPTEKGLRRVLNFGHTLGHAIESASGLGRYLHGECVGLGMIPMVTDDIRAELIDILSSLSLPTTYDGDAEALKNAMLHDKKGEKDSIATVRVDFPGTFMFDRLSIAEIDGFVKKALDLLKGGAKE